MFHRKVIFLIFILLLQIMFLNQWQLVAGKQVEITYDDGENEIGMSFPPPRHLAVKFSLPTNWTNARLLTARYYIYRETQYYEKILYDFKVHVLAEDGLTELLVPPLTVSPLESGAWFNVDLSKFNIVVNSDFYITMEYVHSISEDDHEIGYPIIGVDCKPLERYEQTRSYSGTPGSLSEFEQGACSIGARGCCPSYEYAKKEFMIRAVVQRQYYLTVVSDYGNVNGEGVYDEGTIATFFIRSPIDYDNGTERIFVQWSGDSTANTTTATIRMDAPHTVVAQWRTETKVSAIYKPYIIGGIAVVAILGTFYIILTKRWSVRAKEIANKLLIASFF